MFLKDSLPTTVSPILTSNPSVFPTNSKLLSIKILSPFFGEPLIFKLAVYLSSLKFDV